jgi:hypothetical protein
MIASPAAHLHSTGRREIYPFIKKEGVDMTGFWKAMVVIVCLCIPFGLLSCASIIGKGGPETLNVRSAPDQADVTILDEAGTKIFTGKTPTTVSLEKKRSYFHGKKYSVRISKEGFADQQVTVDTNVNAWYVAGNIVFGGLIGWLIVDPLTGAMWSLDTKELNISLEQAKQGSRSESINMGVMLLEDVPPALRYKMVKLSN